MACVHYYPIIFLLCGIMAANCGSSPLIFNISADNETDIAAQQQHKIQFKGFANMMGMWNCRLSGWSTALWYFNYGCFCGDGSSGLIPVDEVDDCCRIHDACFDSYEAKKKAEPVACDGAAIPILELYAWECKNKEIFCEGNNNICEQFLCECDKALMDCWHKLPPPPYQKVCGESEWKPSTSTTSTDEPTTTMPTTTEEEYVYDYNC